MKRAHLSLSTQLYAAWQQAVEKNKLINEFVAAADDGEGRWQKGEAIAFGIQAVASKQASKGKQGSKGSQNQYYARNLTRACDIQGAVEEKVIKDLGFICQFNGYRALRPGGQYKPLGRQADISPAPEDCRFFCQNSQAPLSLLARQPLLQVALKHYHWNAYYNAAPISPNGHCLWVPGLPSGELPHYPQALSLAFLEDAFALFQQLDSTLLFFNSLHSGASVNHIHFQSLYSPQPLPVDVWPTAAPASDGADYLQLAGYPAQVMVFETAAPAARVFSWIERFQQANIPFNLMLTPARTVLIPRNIDHEIVAEFPGNGIAALGMCGKIITVDRAGYLNANKDTITAAFEKMVLKGATIPWHPLC